MEEKDKKNIFKKFNRYPYEYECKHAVKLVKMCVGSEAGQYGPCYDSISPPPDDLECSRLGERIDELWQNELKRKGAEKASLSLVLFRCLIWDFLCSLLWAGVIRVVLVLMIIESFRLILSSIDDFDSMRLESMVVATGLADSFQVLHNRTTPLPIPQDAQLSDSSTSYELDRVDVLNGIYRRIVGLVICLLVSVSAFYILHSDLKFKFARNGLKCRVAMTQLIQRKSMRLHLSTSIKQSSSMALSLISNEVTFIEEANKHLVFIIIGPWSLAVCSSWLAITQVGWEPVMLTIPALVAFIIIQCYLPKFYKQISQKRKEETNKRIDTINTFLSSIKIVKMYAWEPKFRDKVQEMRQLELKQVRLLDKFTIFDVAVVGIASRVLAAIIFIGYIFINNQLDARILFTTSMAYNYARFDGLFYFPKAVKCLSDLRTACKNIKQYLLLDEFKDGRVRKPTSSLVSPTTGVVQPPPLSARIQSKDLCVTLEPNFTQQQSSEHNLDTVKASQALSCSIGPKIQGIIKGPIIEPNIIDGLNMNLESGDLTFLVGPVGSGKSTLLLTLLGETQITGGSLTISESSRFAYASQEPCIFSDSFKNNILNGRQLDIERYKKVIHVCSLWHDINLLPNGDETLVGPKGVSLSGGQKARLNLARAIYSQADVYLLDDPLSAVDTKVAKHIFTKCIREFLADKLVVLATHQLQFLDQAKKIVVLRGNTKPIFGLASDILEQKNFQSLLEQFESQKVANVQEAPQEVSSEQLVEATQSSSAPLDATTGSSRAEAGNQVGDEEKKESAYLFLLRIGYTKVSLAMLSLVTIIYVIICAFSDYYFRIWSNMVLSAQMDENLEQSEYFNHLVDYWLIYAIIIVLSGAGTSWFQWQLAYGLRNATEELHNMMINSLFRAKMSFYDFCQMGELTSRYAGDFAIVDHSMLYQALLCALTLATMISSLIPMALINPMQIIPYISLFLICWPIAAASYWKLKSLMELSKTLRSPVYTNLASTIDELNTIRSERDHLIFAKEKFDLSQNKLTSMSLLSFVYETYLTTTMKLMSMLMLGIMFFIMFGVYWNDLDMSTAGTFLMLSINASSFYPVVMEYGSLLETSMISVDNVRKYTNLEPEVDELTDANNDDNKKERGEGKAQMGTMIDCGSGIKRRNIEWQIGRVCFHQVSLRYFEDEKPAVDGLTFTIEGGERIGVVGRTGAGKSSIVSVLYRLYPFEGTISIDGVDTQKLSLAELRSSLGVIPQDPVLFCDSLRKNLDPFDVYTDDELWHALEVVDLRQYVAQNLSSGLDYMISEGGRNFSVGQRQLVCLARAVLRSPKVLLIDEATANVDAKTDTFIQSTIRSQFTSSTIITIAHRLNTVLDYDRIMVLDAGKVVEFDTVNKLLELEEGVFKSMLQSGSKA